MVGGHNANSAIGKRLTQLGLVFGCLYRRVHLYESAEPGIVAVIKHQMSYHSFGCDIFVVRPQQIQFLSSGDVCQMQLCAMPACHIHCNL